MGIAYVAAALKAAGHRVRVGDYNIEAWTRYRERIGPAWQQLEAWCEPANWEMIEQVIDPLLQELADEVERDAIEAVGFAMFRPNVPATRRMLAAVRRRRPDVRLFCGGQGVGEELGTELVAAGTVDAVVLGEGELAAVALLQAWQQHGPSAPVEGVLDMDADGHVRFGGARSPAQLDDLPDPDFEDLPRDRYLYTELHGLRGVLPVLGSRGCTNRCVFCSERQAWPHYRFRSGSSLAEELERQSARYGVRHFLFMDSLINGNPAELERLVDLLLARGAEFRWGGAARVDPRLTDEVLAKMARAGCTFLNFGLESGSQRVLDRMHKRVDVRHAYPLIRNARKHGIDVHLNVIVGFPGERFRDFLATLRLLVALRKSIAVVSVYCLKLHRGLRMPELPGEPRVVLGDGVGVAISEDWNLADGSNTPRIRARRYRLLVGLMRWLRVKVI